MNNGNRWLLPEGIEEALPDAAARLERLRRRLLDYYSARGYELVMPPFIEYLESLLTGTGNDLDLQTFKITDQLTGRLMGIRADMTPQVARIDAHHLKRAAPTRLCYIGTVLHTRPDGFAGSRSPLQAGAELYGYAGIEADAEVLNLMIDSLRVAGVPDVHVDLGHVGIFRALVADAGLAGDTEHRLFDALQRKATPEIEALLADSGVAGAAARRIVALVELNGDAAVLAAARKQLAGAADAVAAALDDLERIAGMSNGAAVNFDLAELRGYHYHTGVVFAAYVPGHGQAVAQGGRYDNIGESFGIARPATGFSADLRTLIALSADAAAPAAGIAAPAAGDAGLDAAIAALRDGGARVVRMLSGQAGSAADMGCDRQLVERGGEWVVEPL